MILLVPADVLSPRRPDELFAAEAAAARAADVPVALIDHDALTQAGDAGLAVARVPQGHPDAVYRGWMMSTGQYQALAGALAARGVTLRTSPAQYRRAHELPCWYPALAGLTPDSAWAPGDNRAAFDQARAELGGTGRAVVRDYVKSMKHYWDTAMYIPDLADAGAAWQVASQFRALREDEYTGGFVLRRFEPFTGGEVRTWWLNGECALVTPHPDTPDAPLVEAASLPLAETARGSRRWGWHSPPWTWRCALTAPGGWSKPATDRSAAFPPPRPPRSSPPRSGHTEAHGPYGPGLTPGDGCGNGPVIGGSLPQPSGPTAATGTARTSARTACSAQPRRPSLLSCPCYRRQAEWRRAERG